MNIFFALKGSKLFIIIILVNFCNLKDGYLLFEICSEMLDLLEVRNTSGKENYSFSLNECIYGPKRNV